MEPNAVTPDELDGMLTAAGDYVRQVYSDFHTAFENRYMKEVGLTDLFMMRLAAWVHQQHKIGIIDWSQNENENGADFEIWIKVPSQNPGEFTYRQVYIQAKVLKRGTNGAPKVDFFYESSHGKAKNFQLALLANFAEAQESDAYYVIYDWEEVTFVDARKLLQWLNTDNATEVTGEELNISVYNAFAEPTIRMASDVNFPEL